MALKIAKRGRVDPFIVMDVMREANERAAAGKEVLHMEVGQPGTPAPRGVIEAAHGALDSDRLGYADALGLPALRQRIAAHYREFYGVELPVDRVVVTTGSSGGFLATFLSVFESGDRVALASPSYPAYRNMLTALGVETILLPATARERFQPTVELLEDVEGSLDGLIVTSPSNPSGTMVTAEELRTLAEYCAAKGIRLISDEIYHGITYGREAATAVEFPGVVAINSFSKYFSMTGWRVGWMVVPEDLLRTVECLNQNLYISVPTLSQLAARAAFDCHDELRENVRVYAANRECLLDRLPRAGFDDLAPADGAFYIYANVSKLTNDSPAFCRRMLTETGVATTPGIDFDPERGHAFIRFSFAGPEEEIALAAQRLIDWRR
ncbi:MAG: pyridoxal phosphate-dependent aminotransferase [Alphaproteobacteria bacterium]